MTKGETITDIAAKVLGLETLETRNSDSLDFHEVATWQVREALTKAYEAGARATLERVAARD